LGTTVEDYCWKVLCTVPTAKYSWSEDIYQKASDVKAFNPQDDIGTRLDTRGSAEGYRWKALCTVSVSIVEG